MVTHRKVLGHTTFKYLHAQIKTLKSIGIKTCYNAINTHMKNMHKTYAENICTVGHHPTFQNQLPYIPIMRLRCAYLQSLQHKQIS